MKTAIVVIGILVCAVAVHALRGQAREGTILYEVTVNMHRTLPPERQEMKEMIPEFNTHKDRLVFRGDESLYKTMEDEEQDEFQHEGGAMRMRFRRPMIEYYVNKSEMRQLRAQEFFGKKYLIEDSIRILPWKLGDGSKMIHGYSCKEASLYNAERKQNIVVWYTDQLKPFLGPESFNTLPGTVLLVDINDGERVILAKSIDLTPLKKNDLKVPASGQRVTDTEFTRIRDEQLKKMGAQGGVIIRTN